MRFGDLFQLDMLTKDKDFIIVPSNLTSLYYFARAGIYSKGSIEGPLAQITPKLSWAYFDAIQAQDWGTAWDYLQKLHQTNVVTSHPGGWNLAGWSNFPAYWKFANGLLGRPSGPARRPARLITPEEEEILREGLIQLGLLESTSERIALGV
jgi:dihydrodipicolinate synthase/N-acetylneuraminate lyase